MPVLTVVRGPPGDDLKSTVCAVSAKAAAPPQVFDADAEARAWIARAIRERSAFAGWSLRNDQLKQFIEGQRSRAESRMDLSSLGKHARPVRAAILGVLCDLALQAVEKSDAILVGSFSSAERNAVVLAFDKKFSASKAAEIVAGAHARDAAETLTKKADAGLAKIVSKREILRAPDMEDLVWELQVACDVAEHAVSSAEHAETAYLRGPGSSAADAENALRSAMAAAERVQPSKKFQPTASRGYSYYGYGGYGYSGYEYGRQQSVRPAEPSVPESDAAKLKIVLQAAVDQTKVFSNTVARSSAAGGAYSTDAVEAGKLAQEMLLSALGAADALFKYVKGETAIEQARTQLSASESLMTQKGGNRKDETNEEFELRMKAEAADVDELDFDFSDSSSDEEDEVPVAVGPPKPSVPELAFIEILSGPVNTGYVTLDSIDPLAPGKPSTKSLLEEIEVLDDVTGRPKKVDRHRYAIIDGPRVMHNYPRDSDLEHLTLTAPCTPRASPNQVDKGTWDKVQKDLNPNASRSYASSSSYGSYGSYGSYNGYD